jgi:hypothetical protein
LPYFVLWILSFLFSAIADFLIIKSYTSIGTTRKIFNSIGLVIPAVALVFLGFMDEEHQNLAIALLVVAVGMNSAIYSGFNVNHMDISPNHSGTLMGITNCVSNIFSLLAPLFVQVIVTDEVGLPPRLFVFIEGVVVSCRKTRRSGRWSSAWLPSSMSSAMSSSSSAAPERCKTGMTISSRRIARSTRGRRTTGVNKNEFVVPIIRLHCNFTVII